MAHSMLTEPALPATDSAATTRRRDVVINDQIRVPGWVKDFETFRQWTHSDEFPNRGLIAFLQGDIWVDLCMEEFLTHNQMKMALTLALGLVTQQANLGRFVPDRMRWCYNSTSLSTEPDGLFYAWETLRSGRLRFIRGAKGGVIELQGTSDMMLEIVSDSSVKKDTILLRDLYWQAGIPEYWLVDARTGTPNFQILRHTPAGYVEVESQDGWLPSAVFGRAFKLTWQADPVGEPLYTLETRPVARTEP